MPTNWEPFRAYASAGVTTIHMEVQGWITHQIKYVTQYGHGTQKRLRTPVLRAAAVRRMEAKNPAAAPTTPYRNSHRFLGALTSILAVVTQLLRRPQEKERSCSIWDREQESTAFWQQKR